MPQTASPPSGLPVVRLEVRVGAGRPTIYEVGDGGFLIGSVPGCDLRLPGTNLAPVLALIARHAGGASLRKLAPVQPVLVNGRAVGSTYLDAGDTVSLGGAEIIISVAAGAGPPPMPVGSGDDAVTARQRALLEQVQYLEADRTEWYRRRDEIEAECKRQTEAIEVLNGRLRQQENELEKARADLIRREEACVEAREEVARQRQELEGYGEQAAKERVETQGLRNELAAIRKKLYHQYRTRRDRLDKKQMGVRTAARRLQEQKRRLETALADATRLQQEWAVRQAELETIGGRVDRDKKFIEEQQQTFAERQKELHRELTKRVEDVQERERKAAEERAALDQAQKQHQADLVRLDRIQATFDQRKKQLDAQALDVDKRFEQLQRDSRELEEQATQLDEWHNRLTADTERLAVQKQEQEAAGKQVDQRAAALEGQQAMLAALRTRLERMREELRRQEQALADQRALQEAGEADLRQRTEEVRKMREELEAEQALQKQELQQLDEKRTSTELGFAQLEQAKKLFADQETEQQARKEQLDAMAAEQARQAEQLLARGRDLEEMHSKLLADRQILRDREAALAKSEQTVSALQEQLRKRGEDLASRERMQVEGEQGLREKLAVFEARHKAAEEEHNQAVARLNELRQELTARAVELDTLSQDVAKREEAVRAEGERLEETNRSLANQREELAAERIAREVERQAAQDAANRTRAEFEVARNEAKELARQMPDLETRATSALDRLNRAREQLREHLGEVHAYARQSRDDLEVARKHVQGEVEQVRQLELSLHVARDEHRLAVAAFRQQLIEWQGQVGEMKQAIQFGESRLDRRQAEVNEKAERIANDAAKLAEQAEQLQEQERLVFERRNEMDRHLSDMREWYRRKIRELSGVDASEKEESDKEGYVVALPATEGEAPSRSATDEVPGSGHSILTLTGEVDPGDRQLGDLLRTLELVDADTLGALLLEARRQRKSLRQLLLAGNYLTLYQMALIEGGSLNGLILGPVRVIDRVQSTPHEAVYRVFDPRANREATLRHLAESEMQDAVRPDEFRQRFAAAAAVVHEHVAATYEVLEVGGRPAVLQEWLAGVPSNDWPTLAAAPGVWFRLLSQAALALQATHAAGLIHGHIQLGSFIMTGEGMLKLCGLGEPRWLTASVEGVTDQGEPSMAGDLFALGQVAAAWTASTPTRKGSKTKPLPDVLQAILTRLTAEDAAQRLTSATTLLEELDRASADVPGNATAWERFVRQVRDQSADLALRRSA